MENILFFISSVNKISIISFFITLILLLYQIYLFKKEIKKRKNKINIPDFKEPSNFPKNDLLMNKIDNKKKENFSFSTSFFLNKFSIFLILFLISFFIFILSLIGNKNDQGVISQPRSSEQEKKILLRSKIKIYNNKWKEISEEEVRKILPGTKIIVGIEKIDDLNIDMARIKINQGEWDENSITTNFDRKKNVFYREYQIATNESFLKIEAQLHSKTEGWLGD